MRFLHLSEMRAAACALAQTRLGPRCSHTQSGGTDERSDENLSLLWIFLCLWFFLLIFFSSKYFHEYLQIFVGPDMGSNYAKTAKVICTWQTLLISRRMRIIPSKW